MGDFQDRIDETIRKQLKDIVADNQHIVIGHNIGEYGDRYISFDKFCLECGSPIFVIVKSGNSEIIVKRSCPTACDYHAGDVVICEDESDRGSE